MGGKVGVCVKLETIDQFYFVPVCILSGLWSQIESDYITCELGDPTIGKF